TARGQLERRELVLVLLHAEGLVGLGEAAALSLRRGDPIWSIVRELESIGPGPDGRLQQAASLSPPARAALEIALLDLRAKLAGEPAWRTLGAEAARPIACNATLTAAAPDQVAQQALSWAERGFETFKLKVGMGGDVEQVAAARRALPSGAKVRVDA